MLSGRYETVFQGAYFLCLKVCICLPDYSVSHRQALWCWGFSEWFMTFPKNAWNHWPNNTVSHPRKPESSTTLLWEPCILHIFWINILIFNFDVFHKFRTWGFIFRMTVVCVVKVWYILHAGHAVAQLVEALRYKPEGHGFNSRWCHWNFILT